MRLIAIDSATTSGVAIYDCGLLGRYDTVQANAKAIDQFADTPADLVVIETSYFSLNHAVAHKLAFIQGRWAQAFEERGVETRLIAAKTWQMAVLPGVTSRSKRPELKAASKLFVMNTHGIAVSDDIADAICLGHFAVTRLAAGQIL